MTWNSYELLALLDCVNRDEARDVQRWSHAPLQFRAHEAAMCPGQLKQLVESNIHIKRRSTELSI
eukprot:CAMPEP_0115063430 /NCGR_PEP_ID=MMETSP0227-20121206/9105_1 /TAXON_ID=89957 /ORGANISM="Polarella glacialis, Strain CCMP 1383" /LENGTH=64 /DNA_ID=CAMNT_0002448935 /DNA_START=340 /DNA_END=534 /DNA_ORIENTATION=-